MLLEKMVASSLVRRLLAVLAAFAAALTFLA
jgi:hypothetical protein